MNCVPVYSRADPGHPVPRLGRETATRALSYVAMTRGRDTNTAYLSQRTTEQEDRQAWPEAMSQLGANWRSRPQTARDDRELPDSLQHNAIHPMSDRGSGGRSSNPVSPTQVRGCFWPPNPPPRWLGPNRLTQTRSPPLPKFVCGYMDRTRQSVKVPGPGYYASCGQFANEHRSDHGVSLFRFLAKPESPQQSPIRGERKCDRVAPRRYAADQMQACHQDHRGSGNRLRLEVAAGRVGQLLVIAGYQAATPPASATHPRSEFRIVAASYV